MTARAWAGIIFARALEHGATMEEAEQAARAAFARKRISR